MTITNIRHIGIVVSDMQKELEFYRDLLGMTVWWEDRDESQIVRQVTGVPEANIWMVKLKAEDGVSIELLKYLSHPQSLPEPKKSFDAGCNHVALQVDDIEALYKKLLSAGIRFHTPPVTSSDGAAKVTYCRDPEGVIIELVELTRGAPL
jgi:catechol 2,3-dioxygenase-like lactoylglutathione lyase family enzyme